VGETERKREREREAERKDRTQVSFVADIKLYSMSWQLEDRVKSIGKRNKVRTNKRVKRCETEMEKGERVNPWEGGELAIGRGNCGVNKPKNATQK